MNLSTPFRTLATGIFVLMLGGAMLLALPFSHRTEVPFLDHLFQSVSAVSGTGLVTVSLGGTYTWLGQAILLILFQLGGWGFMTVTSFFFIARQKPLPPDKERVLRASYSLPKGFDLRSFIRHTVVFTLVIETTGALILWGLFSAAGQPDALWSGIFHSVSAFATAGFSLYDDNLIGFAADPWINLTIALLCLSGAVGFIVMQDFWAAIRQKRKITFTTKTILVTTGLIVVMGTLIVFFTEPLLKPLPWTSALGAAAFHVISASATAGFNTLDLGLVSRATLFAIILVMIVGASPSGTGGGIKTTSITALFAVVVSLLRGRHSVSLFRNEIPQARVLTATATAGLYLAVLSLGTLTLCLTDPFAFENLAFEAASALGTVGLSTGITARLSDLGLTVLMALMYIGRVGPLSFGIGLIGAREPQAKTPPTDLAV